MKPWLGWSLCLLCAAPVLAQEAAPAPPPELTAPLRRFQQDDFLLAYEVFVGNGQLESALRVAREAVRQRPADRAWRRRLAQIAEWQAYTDIAAEQWRALYAMGDRSDDTVSSLLRLSNALDDPLAALPAWLHLAGQQALSDAQWEQVYWLFEDASEPSRGSRFFETQYRERHQPLLLELAARLALHAGEEDRALALYRERAGIEPFGTEPLLQAVFIQLRRDRHDDALALMRAHMDKVPDSDADFWRLLGQLAWEAGDFPTSQAAYERGVASERIEPGDWTRLIFLTRQNRPQRAAELSLIAWRRYGSLDLLLQALEIHAERGELGAQGRIYDSLDPGQRARAERNLAFLLGRAQYHQRRQQPRLAWSDLQRALQLAPADDNTIVAALWFLVEAGWPQELTRMLATYEKRAQPTPAYWQPYAAGHLALGQPRRAATWYRRALERAPQDPILLAAYADVLDQLQQTGMADRLRRQAWLRLEAQRAERSALGELMRRPEFQTWVRLFLSKRPGSASLALQRQLQQLWRGPNAEQAAVAGRDELVLGWALDRELPDSARRWVLERYTRLGRSVPVSAQTQLALLQLDQPRIAQLLQGRSRELAPGSQVDLALAGRQTRLAIDSAVRGLQQDPASDLLHEHLRQLLPRQGHYLQWHSRRESYDLLAQQGHELEARLVLSPRLHLLAATSQARQSSSDADFATLVPRRDDMQRAEVRWFGHDSESRLALTQRRELVRYNGLRLQHMGRWSARVSYELEASYRGESGLSLPLRVAGYEHGLMGALSYTLDRQTTLRASPQFNRYYTQYHDTLGSGTSVDLEISHRLRIDYPDTYVRAYTENRSFTRSGGLSTQTVARLPAYLQTGLGDGSIDPVAYFIPQDSSTVGACTGVGGNLSGLSLQDDYSRAWRPYGNACITENSVVGQGYLATLGLAGPVLGADHLRFEWQGSKANVPGGASMHIFSIRYRHYF